MTGPAPVEKTLHARAVRIGRVPGLVRIFCVPACFARFRFAGHYPVCSRLSEGKRVTIGQEIQPRNPKYLRPLHRCQTPLFVFESSTQCVLRRFSKRGDKNFSMPLCAMI
jgi:hypothetical protein